MKFLSKLNEYTIIGKNGYSEKNREKVTKSEI